MSKPNYFMVAFGEDTIGVAKMIKESIWEGSSFLVPNGTRIEPTDIEMPDIFFIRDESGDKTEEEISHFYRQKIYDNVIRACKRHEFYFYVKQVNSPYPIT